MLVLFLFLKPHARCGAGESPEMISKGYLSPYSAWTDIQMVKVLEDTSESLTEAQKQYVYDNKFAIANDTLKKLGYNKTVKVVRVDPSDSKYQSMIKNHAYLALSNKKNGKSWYYKEFVDDPTWGVDEVIKRNATTIYYCWIDRDGCSDFCLSFE